MRPARCAAAAATPPRRPSLTSPPNSFFPTRPPLPLADSSTTPVDPRDAVSERGYILFYRLRGTESLAVKAFNERLAAKLAEGKARGVSGGGGGGGGEA